jgi:hypothetical protein
MIHTRTAGSPVSLQRALRFVERWILGRDASAPALRLLLVGGSFGLYWTILVVVSGFPRSAAPMWIVDLGYPLDLIFELASMFFAPQVLSYLLPVGGALWIGYRLGCHYLADLFDLEDFAIARRYLGPALFGWDASAFPTLDVNTGRVEALDQGNPLVRIGGPGFLRIHLGYAAVVETIDALPRVYGPSQAQFLSGFDRLRDVVDLRDQTRTVGEVRAMTRDGIEVHATDAQMVFRVHRGGNRPRSLQDPYPYNETSIRRLVYGQAVAEEGRSHWSASLPGRVTSQIQRFVENLTIEEFLALRPQPPSAGLAMSFHIPRDQLTGLFHTPEAAERLRQDGLELDWVGVGTWELRDRPGRSPTEIGIVDTVIRGWREKERVDLYGSPGYLERQRDRGFRDAGSDVLRLVVDAWRSGGEGQDVQFRCWQVLKALHGRLALMQEDLGDDPEAPLPSDFEAALAHIEGLAEAHWFGGGTG